MAIISHLLPDAAFIDRADFKLYIGPPTQGAIYEILKSSLVELHRVNLIQQAIVPGIML